MVGRRQLLGALLLGPPAAAIAGALPGEAAREWSVYGERFVTADGRVVDTGNGGISHSEGQGYAMLLAVAFRDPMRFERLWRWTRAQLQIRDDHLLAWRWVPGGTPEPVADRNDAADGDLLVAWALARAAATWAVPHYREAARAIALDVLGKLVRSHGGATVLLPGAAGFVDAGKVTLNLSYWVFPALRALAAVAPAPAWQALAASGLGLLEAARFGRFGLPPDWLALDPPRPAPGFAPRFGYDAVRIPLYLVWAGIDRQPVLAAVAAWAAAHQGAPPATLDLVTGAGSPEPLSAGGRAVLALAARAGGGPEPGFPRLDPAMDYYGASLLLLAKLAYAERFSP